MSGENGEKSNGAGHDVPEGAIDVRQIIASRIHAFAKHLSEEDVVGLVNVLVQEEQIFNEKVLPKVLDTTHPWMYLELKNKMANAGMRIQALKDLASLGEIDPKERFPVLINHVLMVALLTDGITARGILRAYGWDYGLGEMPQQVVAPKVQLVT